PAAQRPRRRADAPGPARRDGAPVRQPPAWAQPGGAGVAGGEEPPRRPSKPFGEAPEDVAPRPARREEVRLYGMNAVQAVFARRPQAIRKLYLLQSRVHALRPLLAWCVQNRVGYRVVEAEDLDRLAASSHHEGVVAELLRT